MRRVRALTASVAAVAAVALALLPVAGASAHDYLVNSDPGAGATVTAPQQQVTLTFNDRVLDLTGDGKSSIIEVTDAAGRYFETGCATTADTVVSAPVALGPAGAYTVTYQVVSADGHTVSNSFPFTYQPPAGTAEAAGSASPTCGQVAVAPSPAPDRGGHDTRSDRVGHDPRTDQGRRRLRQPGPGHRDRRRDRRARPRRRSDRGAHEPPQARVRRRRTADGG